MIIMNFENLRVVVTGASRGIGEELARGLAAQGARIVAIGRDPRRLDQLRRVHPEWEVMEGSLDAATDREQLADEILGRGSVDVLINNAGTQTIVDARSPVDWEILGREIEVNLGAPIHLIHLLLPSLLERRTDAPMAAIVNVTSGLALAPKAAAAPYCATKAGLRSYSKALRRQLRDTPVRVVEALPSLVKTDMTAGRNDDAISAKECAEEMIAGMRADRDEIYVGKVKLLRAVMRIAPSIGERKMRDA